MLIVVGDSNARPGSVGMATRRILGKFALGTRCAYGDRLVHFSSMALKQAVNMFRIMQWFVLAYAYA